MTTEKMSSEEARARLQALTDEAAANWRNRDWHFDMAAEMTEVINRGFDTENLVELLAETENLGWTDRSSVEEVRGMRAFWIARGGDIEESTIHSETFEIQRDIVGFHVSEDEDKLKANFGPKQAQWINLGIQRLTSEVNMKVLRTFQAAVPSSSPYYTAASGLSLSTLNTALAEVLDAQVDGAVTIVARHTMVNKIIDGLIGLGSGYGGFIPNTNEELLRTGRLGTYRGAEIVVLRNFLNEMDASVFPAGELWVVGRNASKFAFFGGGDFREFTEDGFGKWHYMYRREFGGLVYRPERLRRIIDTSQ